MHAAPKKQHQHQGYLKNQIAFAELLFAWGFRAETSPPFSALFLEVLQDLEKKKQEKTHDRELKPAPNTYTQLLVAIGQVNFVFVTYVIHSFEIRNH